MGMSNSSLEENPSRSVSNTASLASHRRVSTLEKPAPAGASGPETPPCQPGLGRARRQVGVASQLCYNRRPGTHTGQTSASQGHKGGGVAKPESAFKKPFNWPHLELSKRTEMVG